MQAWSLLLLVGFVSQPSSSSEQRFRARELGLKVGVLPTGRWNAITDVHDVRVGQVTLMKDSDIRTGVTAIVPHGGNLFLQKVPAAVHVANGFGKLMGSTQIDTLGNLETPILLTGTLNVPRVADALLDYMLALPGLSGVRSINPVVGETNDGYLSAIRQRPIGRSQVFQALRQAVNGPVQEGSVGAGTGTICYGFKGGIGTASRVLPEALGGYTLGVLVQTNFGGVLRMHGVPLGRELGKYYLRDFREDSSGDGSCMIVVATDAPLSARNLKRLAQRAMLGLAATGGTSTNGSGDYVIAFSTSPEVRIPHSPAGPSVADRLLRGGVLHNRDVSPLFQAAKESTEEAIYNSMLMATSVQGRADHRIEALPLKRTYELLKKYGAVPASHKYPGSRR